MGKRISCIKQEEIEEPKQELKREPSFHTILHTLSDDDLEYKTRVNRLSPTSKVDVRDSEVVLVFETIKNERMKLFKCLVERFEWDYNSEVDGDTILTYCARFGSSEKFRYILDLPNIDIHHTTSSDYNAVVICLSPGKEIQFQDLIDKKVIPFEAMDLPEGTYSQKSLAIAYQIVIVQIRSYLLFVHGYSSTSFKHVPFSLVREIASFI